MVPSDISQSVPTQPNPVQRKSRKQSRKQSRNQNRNQNRERSQLTLWSVATLFFLLGAAASGLVIWQLHKLYRATIAPLVTVEGTLQAKYGYQAGDKAQPAPDGYFVESSGMGRVYLTGQPLNAYVGQPIQAQGSVAGICGPKSVPCFPLVEVREVGLAAEAQ